MKESIFILGIVMTNSVKTRKSSRHISLVLLGGAGLGIAACSPQSPTVAEHQPQQQEPLQYTNAEAQALQEQAAALQAQAAELEMQAQEAQADASHETKATAADGSGVGSLLAGAAAGAAAGYVASKVAGNRAATAQASQTAQTPTTTQQPAQNNQQATNSNRQSLAQATQDNRAGTTRQGFGATGGTTGAAS